MTKTISRDTAKSVDMSKIKSGEAIPYRQLFDNLAKSIEFVEGFVVTSTPRGGLQIAQPSRIPEVLVKAYAATYFLEDRATWMVTQKGKALRGTEAWGTSYDQCRYVRDFLLYNCNLYHMIVVPLKAPIYAGYPGAVHLYRYREQGPFTDAEIAILTEFAKQLDDAAEQTRLSRRPPQCLYQNPWAHRLSLRQLIFDAKGHCVYGASVFEKMDERLRQQIVQHTQTRLARLKDSQLQPDRLQTPDSRGDLWTFRVSPFKNFGAFGDTPHIIFTMTPEACDWATVRHTDFQADSEMMRLLPAIRFMQQEFHRSPSLGEVAQMVHLSPFHFHRRFTELVGLTPKHMQLECQIFEAKRQLMARQKELSQIAADCGFAHQSHFTSRFKQATGLTPTRWRRVAQDMQRASA